MADVAFSIVTPVLNAENTISRTIESVLNQTYPASEYFVVDGNSIDRTVEIAKTYEERFDAKGILFKVISEEDSGIYDAMNKGISLCRGELIGIINADDWYEENALKIMKDLYTEEPYDMAYADLRIHSGESNFVKRARDLKITSSRRWNHPTQFVRKTVYQKKKYDTDGVFADLDFLLWMIDNGYCIRYINKTIANFTMGGQSNRGKKLKDVTERVRQKWQIYRRYGYNILYLFDIILIETAKRVYGKE
ncbi:MAG: glycosyltransferase [Butyrivibrio sp.]|nr:glycosyltransferase [Butyrivibrio sp.]